MNVKREAWLTYITLVPIVTSVVIASGGEPSFHLFGLIMCVGAIAARALKSVIQGILLSYEGMYCSRNFFTKTSYRKMKGTMNRTNQIKEDSLKEEDKS
ncbi:hypothetical protein IFM89_015820, partial [Coptis chinensis]